MADRFEQYDPGLNGCADPGAPITSGSDTADLAGGTCRGFYISADCSLTFLDRRGTSRGPYTLIGGQTYPWRVSRVMATGSTFGSAQFVPLY